MLVLYCKNGSLIVSFGYPLETPNRQDSLEVSMPMTYHLNFTILYTLVRDISDQLWLLSWSEARTFVRSTWKESGCVRAQGLFTSRGKGPEPKEMQWCDWWKQWYPTFGYTLGLGPLFFSMDEMSMWSSRWQFWILISWPQGRVFVATSLR
jgi:hypothetical protein